MSPGVKDETFGNPEISTPFEVRDKLEETGEFLFERMQPVLSLTSLAERGYENLIL